MAKEEAKGEAKKAVAQDVKPFTESSLADLFGNERLSDMSLRNPDTNASTRIHKAVLASGSKYFMQVFCQSNMEILKSVDVPRPINTDPAKAQNAVSDEHVNKIVKYMYHNQDFKVIKKEINEANVSAFYSQVHVMRCTKLLEALEDMIVHELLTPVNSSLFYVDSIRFQSKKIGDACEMLIQQHIDEILKTDKGTSFLLGLPFERMHSLCSKSSLCISDEQKLVTLFTKYIEHRDAIRPLLPEEDPKSDIEKYLTPEEIEGRKKAKEEAKVAADAKKDEEAKAKEAEFAALDPLGQENMKWHRETEKSHAAAAAQLKLKRLSKDEKKQLFKTIRYSFIKHEDLLQLTTNKTFELAKEFIIEGLSVRLNPYENGIKETVQISVEPRANYKPPAPKDKKAGGQIPLQNTAGGPAANAAGVQGLFNQKGNSNAAAAGKA